VTRFLAGRLLLLVPTLLGVLALTFFLLYVAPGDPVQAMVGERADPETLARLRAELHLDDPFPVRFVRYVGGVLRGDLGTSYITRRPILGDLLQRFPATLRLAGAAMLFAAVTGIAIGIWGAWRPGGWADRIGALGAYLGVSFPVYWVGLILILGFAVYLRWLPPSGSGGLEYLVLPAIALGMRSVAFLSRMTRAAMQEVLQSDYVRTARAKGLGEGRVVLSHAFRNALLPVVTVLGLDFGSYLTGSILTETIFSWPGVGRYVLTAIDKRDLPAVQGSILFLSVVFVFVNLLTDLLYAKVDPRVAYD
jgi:peptide/nickel transport system permease protein/oligopeptide transport system permease protein